LLAQTTGFASLDVFEFHRSADVMLALVIGGAGWLWGGSAGAIAFKVLHDLISAITPQYWTFWIGLFLVVLMLVGRDRLFRPGALVHKKVVMNDVVLADPGLVKRFGGITATATCLARGRGAARATR
jgi:hypothetical protein